MKLAYGEDTEQAEVVGLHLQLKGIGASIRESVDDIENAEKAFSIYQQLLVGKLQDDPTRRYVNEGPIDYKESHFIRQGYLLLFNDILVVTSRSI